MPRTTAVDRHAQTAGESLLSIREVTAIVKLGSSAIYARVAAGTFPNPYRLSSRCTRWKASEIRAWLEAL